MERKYCSGCFFLKTNDFNVPLPRDTHASCQCCIWPVSLHLPDFSKTVAAKPQGELGPC